MVMVTSLHLNTIPLVIKALRMVKLLMADNLLQETGDEDQAGSHDDKRTF